jgi:hypothetical protein
MNLALASNGLVTIKATGLPNFSRSTASRAVLAELVPVKPRRTIMPSLYSAISLDLASLSSGGTKAGH